MRVSGSGALQEQGARANPIKLVSVAGRAFRFANPCFAHLGILLQEVDHLRDVFPLGKQELQQMPVRQQTRRQFGTVHD